MYVLKKILLTPNCLILIFVFVNVVCSSFQMYTVYRKVMKIVVHEKSFEDICTRQVSAFLNFWLGIHIP